MTLIQNIKLLRKSVFFFSCKTQVSDVVAIIVIDVVQLGCLDDSDACSSSPSSSYDRSLWLSRSALISLHLPIVLTPCCWERRVYRPVNSIFPRWSLLLQLRRRSVLSVAGKAVSWNSRYALSAIWVVNYSFSSRFEYPCLAVLPLVHNQVKHFVIGLNSALLSLFLLHYHLESVFGNVRWLGHCRLYRLSVTVHSIVRWLVSCCP